MIALRKNKTTTALFAIDNWNGKIPLAENFLFNLLLEYVEFERFKCLEYILAVVETDVRLL